MRLFLTVLTAALLLASPSVLADAPKATVYKSPTCGCCTGWAQHLADEGFRVETRDVENLGAIKRMLGVPGEFQSCHTAMIGGYVVEGHVPAEVLEKLLAERPKIRGIAMPGMPIGTPGMPGPKEETWRVYTLEEKPKVFWQK